MDEIADSAETAFADAICILDAKRAEIAIDADGPITSHLLEAQRGMPRVTAEEGKGLVGAFANTLRKCVLWFPEPRAGAMVSQWICRVSGNVRLGFGAQKVELAGAGILLDLPVPTLPTQFLEPIREIPQFLVGEGRHGAFDLFELASQER